MPAKGCSMSPETRAKISAAMTGRPKTKKHRAAIRRSVLLHYAQRAQNADA